MSSAPTTRSSPASDFAGEAARSGFNPRPAGLRGGPKGYAASHHRTARNEAWRIILPAPFSLDDLIRNFERARPADPTRRSPAHSLGGSSLRGLWRRRRSHPQGREWSEAADERRHRHSCPRDSEQSTPQMLNFIAQTMAEIQQYRGEE